MTVYNFLSSQFQIPQEILDMMYHTGISCCDVKEVFEVCGIRIINKNKDQLAFELADALLSCYSNSDNFNEKLYFEFCK